MMSNIIQVCSLAQRAFEPDVEWRREVSTNPHRIKITGIPKRKPEAGASKVTYTGDTLRRPAEPPWKYALVEVDKESRLVTDVIPFERIRVRPVVEGIDDVEGGTRHKQPGSSRDFSNLSARQQREETILAFGSSRAKRSIENNVGLPLENESLRSAVAKLKAEVTLDRSSSTESASAIPPANRNAVTPADIYDLARDVLPPPPDSQELQGWVDGFLDSLALPDTPHPRWVTHRSTNLPPKQRQLKGFYLLYLSSLISLYNMKANEIKKRDRYPDWIPEFVAEHLNVSFLVASRDTRGTQILSLPYRMRDKCLAHSLLLALYVDNFVVDIGDLTAQLGSRVGLGKVQTIARALGCTFSKNKEGRKLAKLEKAPEPVAGGSGSRGGRS